MMNITSLGEARFPSPVPHTVSDRREFPPLLYAIRLHLSGMTYSLSSPGRERSCSLTLPIEMLVLEKKQVNPDSIWWRAVLAATGQPVRFE
jgi:hypothetical protein